MHTHRKRRRDVLILGVVACLAAGVASVSAAPPKPEDVITWVMAEPVQDEAQLQRALSVQPDAILRGWFKWWSAPDWRRFAPVAQEAEKRNILFGGGVTCSALQERENGLTHERFLALVARNPRNEPAVFYGNKASGCFHGAIEKKEYLDYVLGWAFKQVDAGATMLFMDEVNGAATEFTGYSDEGIAAFRDFLIAKYVQGAGWQLNDPRWTSKFKIKLDDRDECPDGTIRTFNYRACLKRLNALDQPTIPDRNALAVEWGPPQDAGDDTYCGRRNGAAWKYMVDGIRRYAADRRRTVYIAANGLNRWVDYQIEGVWDSWPVKDGRLTLGPCYIPRWRGALDWSRNALGRDVPLVVFHDWGFDIPWEKIPKEDRILWLRVYAPEIFAAGAQFAWPISGCGGSTRADKNGTLDEIRRLAAWYRLNAELYRGAEWIGLDAAKTESAVSRATEPLVVTALLQQSGTKRRILHVINKQLVNHELAPRENLRLEIPSGAPPKAVWAVSPDFEGRKPLKFSFERNAVSLSLDRLDAYTVLALEYEALPNDDDLLFPRVLVGTVRQWGMKGGREFELDRRGIRKSDGLLSGYLHGAYHQEMRVRPSFRAVFGPNGSIGIRVNSVAMQGAELVIRLDGRELTRWKLPDLDHKNAGDALEYDKLFSAKVPPGAHAITIENAGGDWLTMDYVVFEGIAGALPEGGKQ